MRPTCPGLFDSARGGHATVGMCDQANVLKVLPFHNIHNISNMGVEIDVFA